MLTMANPAESWDRNPVTPTEFSALRGQVHSFEGMAAVLIENLPLIGGGDPESVTVARVTSNYFALLGVPAHVGRTFVPGEGPAKQQFNVIISSDLWQRSLQPERRWDSSGQFSSFEFSLAPLTQIHGLAHY